MPKLLTHPHYSVQPLLILCAVIYTPALLARDFDVDLSRQSGPTMLTRLSLNPTGVAFVGDPPEGLKPADVKIAITRSVDSWNGVSCSTSRFEYLGHRDLESLSPDDVVVRFASPADEECLPDGFLGFTVGCRGHRTVMLSTVDARWETVPSPYDLDNPLRVDATAVITHELGHVLGLGHDDTDARNTMTTRYLKDGGQASLSALDKLALCELYPVDRSECSNESDCEAGHPCVQANGVSVCDDERGDPGDYCGAELLICPFACEFSSLSTQTGYCTNPCADDTECQNDMVCVDQACSVPTVIQTGGCQSGQSAPIWWSLMGLLLWWRRSPRKQRSSSTSASRWRSQ